MAAVGLKRKRDLPGQGEQVAPVVNRPKAGTKAFTSGKAVKDGLGTGSPQAFVSFRQQIVTPYSALPLAINHPTVVILQHYLDASSTCEEVFRAWQIGHETKNEVQTHAAVELLSEIINILTPIPFFRSTVVGLVNKIIATADPYHDYLNRLCQSGRRDDVYHGFMLSAAAMNVDPPWAATLGSQTTGRLGLKVWSILVEGGSVRGLGKQMGMRRRNKEGMVAYGENDPLDKPDVRHHILRLILPLLSTSAFHAHARSLLPPMYSGLSADPPITVYRVLTALWSAISTSSPGLNRRTSLVLFHEKSIEHLWQLFSRQDQEPSTGKTVSNIVSAFLEGITTVPGRGVCFHDEGWYPRKAVDENSGGAAEDEFTVRAGGIGLEGDEKWRKGLHNRILGNVVRKVGNKVVDDNGLIGTWVTKVFEACPELIAGYWAHSALSLEPRLNARWIATMSYVGRIISLPAPSISTFRQPVPHGLDPSGAPFRAQPPAVSTMIESILPSPLTKSHLMKGLQHTDALVQHVTAITLARGLQKLAIVQELLKLIEKEVGLEPSTSQENLWTRRRRELELEVRKRIPELSVIIAFAQKAATMAPSEAETDAEIAMATKSAMLTEVALRIFGLCNKTLPSMATEMKFDPGRLLVSASSASAERRARREAREGNVKGFEALSQLHVLELLGEVRDWNWMNKAAGSQYTYLYHILLLQLSTQQPMTLLKTVSLLQHLLLPTLLYEHDPSELSIWLDALPRTSNTVSGPMLLAQQIHLLSFLDDCFRRAIKTPYRYLEDSFALVPDFFEYTRPTEMVSPVLMTILEQLNAKIMGQLISTEAAGVVLIYLRRVLLGLTGKQREMAFVSTVINKLKDMLHTAKEAGQARVGLMGVVEGMEDDMAVIEGKKPVQKITDIDYEAPHMRDESDWTLRSFEKICLTTTAQQWENSAWPAEVATTFIKGQDDDTVIRRCRFLLHLLAADQGVLATSGAQCAALNLIRDCLASVSHKDKCSRLKVLVFEHDSIRKLYLKDAGSDERLVANDLILPLDEAISTDQGLGETFAIELVDVLKADKKGKNAQTTLSLLRLWTRFVSAEVGQKALKTIVKRSEKIVPSLTPETVATVWAVVLAANDPAYAVDHLKDLIQLQAVPAVVELVKKASKNRVDKSSLSEISVKKDTVRELLSTGDNSAYELLAELAAVSSGAAKSILSVLSKDDTTLIDTRLVPTAVTLLDLPSDTPIDVAEIAMSTLTSRTSPQKSTERSAIKLVTSLIETNPQRLNEIIRSLELANFTPSIGRLTEALATRLNEDGRPAHDRLIELGLQYAVRLCSAMGEISQAGVDALEHMKRTVEMSAEIQLPTHLAEPVITAIIQDRLDVVQAVELAAVLSKRTELKASFIRQQLQALLSSSAYTRCTNSSCPADVRLQFIRLVHSLFSASTYVSCQPNFIEPLLVLYRGTIAEPDRLILNMFQLFEGYRKISVASILRFWSSNGLVGSGNRSFDALTSLDPAKVFTTCQNYPLRRSLRGHDKQDQKPDEGENLYDPVFVMGLLSSTMCEGTITGLDWVEILRSNVLSLTVCGLSSRDAEIRALANYILAKAFSLILKKPFFERNQLLYTLRLLRHAIPTASTRLPTLTTLFFAHALRALANPSNFLYPLTSRFLLQRPVYDVTDTPMLYGMLYASGDEWRRERGWMVRFLRDGIKSEADWRVLRRRKVWSLLASLFSSSMDPVFRRSVLQTMENMTTVPAAARTLVLRDALILWLNMQWTKIGTQQPWAVGGKHPKSQSWEKDEKSTIISIAEKVCISMIPAEVERVGEGKEAGRWLEHVEMLIQSVLNDDIDIDRLEMISRIVLRLSTVNRSKLVPQTLPTLVDKLKALESASISTATSANEAKERVTLYLFQAGLSLSPQALMLSEALRAAVEEIGWRAVRGDAGSVLSDWVKRERRMVEWSAK
ncbi:hypothetical protein I317_00945 [Kwoniella heveanensis CBS 569]|nr:hypothetical protein I317_00945 [Kwoniella heveanensis CBS 569]